MARRSGKRTVGGRQFDRRMDDEARCGSEDRILAEGFHRHVFLKLPQQWTCDQSAGRPQPYLLNKMGFLVVGLVLGNADPLTVALQQ